MIGLLGETHKLGHLGITYVARRSTLAEANERRSAEFFEKVYYGLFERVKPFLPDNNKVKCFMQGQKENRRTKKPPNNPDSSQCIALIRLARLNRTTPSTRANVFCAFTELKPRDAK